MDALRLPERLAARLPGRLPGRLGDDGHPVVSLVRLHGVITPTTGPVPRSVINSVSTEKVLERAFAPERLAAVALLVNSPGGSPTQSALVADRIRGLADEHDVPVLAFCEDVAASGGYWLACAADEIYAHPTSIVGSIGVISQSFGLEGLLAADRCRAAALHRGRGQVAPRPVPAREARRRRVAARAAGPAARDVPRLGGGAARRPPRVGRRAVQRRGVDRRPGGRAGAGRRARHGARACSTERFPDAELVPIEGRRPLLARLGIGAAPAALKHAPADLVAQFAQAAEIRATWARYGL